MYIARETLMIKKKEAAVTAINNANEASTLQSSTHIQNPMMARDNHPVQMYEINIAPK